MKKITLSIISLAFLAVSAFAQKTSDEYLTRYNLLVNKLGPTGLGIETILDKWREDFPDDRNMLCARANFYFAKSVSTKVEAREGNKYLGQKPVVSLKDSLGETVNYFEVRYYEDSLFAIASQSIDRAVKLNENDLDLRFRKLNALLLYEKESPDMTTQALKSLIDYNYVSKPVWVYDSSPVTEPSFFENAVQEYCAAFYDAGTTASLASFRTISEKMLSYNSKNAQFLCNLGTYYLVAEKDNRQALKYYSKALKYDPKNYSAIKNCVLVSRREKDLKSEKKYLQMLLSVSESDSEKAAAKARLDAIGS